MKYTDKQLAIMNLVVEGNGRNIVGDFVPIDMDQLLERLPYKTTKQSMQFSIRTLMKHGAMTKGELDSRRGRKRVVYLATELGEMMAKKRKGSGFLVSEDPVIESLTGETPASEDSFLETLSNT